MVAANSSPATVTRSIHSLSFGKQSRPGDGKTVLDGEIVCLDKRGRPQFNDLLFHRGEPCFFAFDLLMDDGKDLRSERLTDRKHELRRLLSKAPTSRMRYVEHVEQYGTALFERACKDRKLSNEWSTERSRPHSENRFYRPDCMCGGLTEQRKPL